MENKDNKKLIIELAKIINSNKDKRVLIVGTTCTGKTTFLKYIKNAFDMDELVFPKLTKAQSDYVCQSPWTSEIGKAMSRLTKEKVRIKPGQPIFGTVVLDSDLVVYLHISDELLKKRTALRGVNFKDAKNMQKQIETEIKQTEISIIEFKVG
jgi:adenylate kinase family enzyme